MIPLTITCSQMDEANINFSLRHLQRTFSIQRRSLIRKSPQSFLPRSTELALSWPHASPTEQSLQTAPPFTIYGLLVSHDIVNSS